MARLFLTLADSILAVLLLVIALAAIISDQDPLSLLGLAVSLTVAYLATIRQSLKRPRLRISPDEIRCSPPTIDGDKPSWFARIRVTNVGLSVARDCTGRLLSVWTADGSRVVKFDPLTLYWSRQDRQTGHIPRDVQHQGDVEFLDIFQAKVTMQPSLHLRVVLPEPMTLSKGTDDSPSPGTDPALKPGVYYLRVGVFSANSEPAIQWLETSCLDEFPEDCEDPNPFTIRSVSPQFGQ